MQRRIFRSTVTFLWATFLAMWIASSAHGQTVRVGNEKLYLYRGADRDQRILENARREGIVVLYTSLAPSESGPLSQAFEKKHGIKVELWRALSEKVVQRALTEARARRFA